MKSNRKVTFQIQDHSQSEKGDHPKFQYSVHQSVYKIKRRHVAEPPNERRHAIHEGHGEMRPYQSKIKLCNREGNRKYCQEKRINVKHVLVDRLASSMANKCSLKDVVKSSQSKHYRSLVSAKPRFECTVGSCSSNEDSSVTTSDEKSPNTLALKCKAKLMAMLPDLSSNIEIVCVKRDQLRVVEQIDGKQLVILLFTGCWDSETCRVFERFLVKKCNRHPSEIVLFIIDICSANWLTSLHCVTTVPTVEIWRSGMELFHNEGVYNGKASDVLKKIKSVIASYLCKA
ncbi:hypothetical protein GJ496_011239 [Pomphorhynchus laevis]|nr:hypothetical protein GJ496_011239 [Pomphorhynchus laevis]